VKNASLFFYDSILAAGLLTWYLKAAEQGDLEAQLNLDRILLDDEI
jgi:hypothetical protein